MSKQLTIVSRADTTTHFVQFNSGLRGAVEKVRTNRPAPGTTVTVTGLCYRKLSKLDLTKAVSTLARIKQLLICLSLNRPRVQFSLRNDTSGKHEFILKTGTQTKPFDQFRAIFGHTADTFLQEVKPLNYISRYINITGFFSTLTSSSPDMQFFTVNNKVAVDQAVGSVFKSVFKSLDDKFREKNPKHPVFFISFDLKKEGTHWFQYSSNFLKVTFKSKSSVVNHLEKAVQGIFFL